MRLSGCYGPQHIADAGEVHMHRARPRVGTAQRVAGAGSGNQLAFRWLGAEALGGDRDLAAQRYAVFVLVCLC